MPKMFIAVRKDLGPIYKMVQGSHALAKFALEHTQMFNIWNNETIVFIDVENIQDLDSLYMKLQMNNIESSIFSEPDIGNQITAIAFLETDSSKKITKKYNLAGL